MQCQRKKGSRACKSSLLTLQEEVRYQLGKGRLPRAPGGVEVISEAQAGSCSWHIFTSLCTGIVVGNAVEWYGDLEKNVSTKFLLLLPSMDSSPWMRDNATTGFCGSDGVCIRCWVTKSTVSVSSLSPSYFPAPSPPSFFPNPHKLL